MALGEGAAFKLNLNRHRSLTGCIRAKILKLPLGGLHVKHAEQSGIWIPTQHLLCDQERPRKTLIELAGRRTFLMQTEDPISASLSALKTIFSMSFKVHVRVKVPL
jgi:hypothetical protein